MNKKVYPTIDAYVEAQMARLSIPGAALTIVEGDQIVHMRGFGRSRPGGELPTPQTPFFIGSLTKSFTALAVMQLVEAGKVELDAPIQRYLPWFCVEGSWENSVSQETSFPQETLFPQETMFPEESAQMTVRHLLNQTSGLSTWSGWTPLADFDNRPGAAERQAHSLSTYKLTRPVGSAYEYSNTNYNLLGLIVEAASGEPYADYVQTHIFHPLGMCHSYTSPAQAQQNGLATGHRFWFWFPRAVSKPQVPEATLASGQLICSAEDMGRYLIAQLNEGRCGGGQILSPAGITEMRRPAAAIQTMGWSAHYGMGWYNEEHAGTRLIWHTGFVPDFSAYMAFLPEQKKGVILLFNADHFMMNPVMTEIGHGLVDLLAEQPAVPGPFGFSIASLVPWMMRALLLIPLLQILGIGGDVRRLRRWQQDPRSRPGRGRMWGLQILLPLAPDLALAAVPLYLQRTKKLGFLRLFFPDFSWIAVFCGALAGVWAFLRTFLTLRSMRKRS